MKTTIVEYFKTDRSHATGSGLVSQFSKRLALKKQINLHPANDYMTGVIHEELRELAGISRAELKAILEMPAGSTAQPVSAPIKTKGKGSSKANKAPKAPKAPKAQNSKKASRKK